MNVNARTASAGLEHGFDLTGIASVHTRVVHTRAVRTRAVHTCGRRATYRFSRGVRMRWQTT